MSTPRVSPHLHSVHVVRTSVNGAGAGMFEFSLRYRRSDPYAMWMTFDGMYLCCARDLLLDALTSPARVVAGDGDVRIHCDDAYAHIELPHVGRRVTVHVPRVDAERFAAGTLESVALGEESWHVDVDAAITEILCSA